MNQAFRYSQHFWHPDIHTTLNYLFPNFAQLPKHQWSPGRFQLFGATSSQVAKDAIKPPIAYACHLSSISGKDLSIQTAK